MATIYEPRKPISRAAITGDGRQNKKAVGESVRIVRENPSGILQKQKPTLKRGEWNE